MFSYEFWKIFKNTFFYRIPLVAASGNVSSLRTRLDHITNRKFQHGFQGTLNRICSCHREIESSIHYFLHCPKYNNKRIALLNKIRVIKENILKGNGPIIVRTLTDKLCNR